VLLLIRLEKLASDHVTQWRISPVFLEDLRFLELFQLFQHKTTFSVILLYVRIIS